MTSTTKNQTDSLMQQRRALIGVAAVGALAVLLTTPTHGIAFGLNIAGGAALACGNLWLTCRVVGAFLAERPGPWTAVALVKFSLLIAALYLLFRSGLVQGLPFIIGLGALPVGVALAQFAPAHPIREG